jgi:hypothetical protein
VRIALTANGPGEVAGWVRPLLRRLYARDPHLDAHLFLVPDDYATGGEATMARALFPNARVYDPGEYVRFALGRSVAGEPPEVDVVQYMGGDLMHAARLRKRLGGVATAYKFSRSRYAATLARAFAVDAANVKQLRAWGVPEDRIVQVGNLAIDGALLEAEQPLEDRAPIDGILIMPGSRRFEVEEMIPFFLTAARRIHRERPEIPIAFGLSPFTDLDAVRAALARGGDARMWSEKGRLVREGDDAYAESTDGSLRVPILRNAMAAAKCARLVLTIPGTKAIELAALGVPAISTTPFNAPELITINGALTYLDRVPLIGRRLKAAAVLGFSKRFTYHTQPNIDANEAIIAELHGTLTPGRVARAALDRFDDAPWIAATGARLRDLYTDHIGAADRMAASLLELVS